MKKHAKFFYIICFAMIFSGLVCGVYAAAYSTLLMEGKIDFIQHERFASVSGMVTGLTQEVVLDDIVVEEDGTVSKNITIENLDFNSTNDNIVTSVTITNINELDFSLTINMTQTPSENVKTQIEYIDTEVLPTDVTVMAGESVTFSITLSYLQELTQNESFTLNIQIIPDLV